MATAKSSKSNQTCTDNSSIAKYKITIKGASGDLTSRRVAAIAANKMILEGPDDQLVSYNMQGSMNPLPLKLNEPDKNFLDKARAKLANLNKCYYNDLTQAWQFTEKAILKDYEVRIIDGFCNGMYNSVGRMAVTALLHHLFCDESEVLSVRNIGGSRSQKDPFSRVVHFILSLEELSDESSPSESSPSSASSVSYEIRPTQEEADCSEPIAKRLKEKSSPPSREKGISKFKKRFTPDIVLTRRLSTSSLKFEELLAVEIKSCFSISKDHEAQMLYELLPMLMQKNEALGLLFCASQANLYRYKVLDEKYVHLEYKTYSFTSPTQLNKGLTAAVVDMCCDLHTLLDFKL